MKKEMSLSCYDNMLPLSLYVHVNIQMPLGNRIHMKKNNQRLAHPKGRQVDPQTLEEIRHLLGDRPRNRDLLIEYLHLLQDTFGHISPTYLAALADEMALSQVEVYEVATFYAHFDTLAEGDTPPPPLTVRICDGPSCEMAGAKDLHKELIATLKDAMGDRVRVVPVPCVGACDTAPAAVIGENRIGNASVGQVTLDAQKGNLEPTIPSYTQLDAYQANGGYRTLQGCLSGKRSRDDILKTLETSGLRGLGGAGFPVATKWRFLVDKPKPRVIAVNADEGEPGTFKDRHILETNPHRMLEGALLAAWTLDVQDIYIYLRDEYPHIHDILLWEIPKLAEAGLSDHSNIHLRRGAGSYVCGEETALLESLEGKRGLPRIRPPFPAEVGLFGRPTLINNVETLYWTTEILDKGADWYQNAGRPHFYSVSGRVKEPGVKLAPAGITVNELIQNHAGGMSDGHRFKGYMPGGASGGILPASKGDLPLDFGKLEEYGCFVGSAAVIILSDQDDIRETAQGLNRFFEHESCGQCTPCRVGTEKMATLLAADKWDLDLIEELSQAMRDASICGLGQAAPNPISCAIKFFPEDVQ